MCASCSSLCDGMGDNPPAIDMMPTETEVRRGGKLTALDKFADLSSNAIGGKTS